MTLNYDKMWQTMNDLEMVTSKICSAREILDCAIDAHQEHRHEKVEHLLNAVDEYLQYYLQEFDSKFKDAWQATVREMKNEEYSFLDKDKLQCDRDDPSPECQKAWNDFWESDTTKKEDQKSNETVRKKWIIPVELDGPSGEYFIIFPDDLMEAANLQEGDEIEWIDQGDGSYLLKKVDTPDWVKGDQEWKNKTYDEMVADGWSMSDDGFWIKEN